MRKEIKICNQPKLGFIRTFRITLDGIRYRLFRASVTVSVIAVAVAFLMNILSESLIKRAIGRSSRERIESTQIVHKWALRLVQPGTPQEIVVELAKANEGDAVYRETAVFGNLSPETMKSLHSYARTAAMYLSFFDGLGYGQRRRLVHASTGCAVFDRLTGQDEFSSFRTALSRMLSVRFATSLEEFEKFLAEWPEARKTIDRVREGRLKAVRRIKEELGSQSVYDALPEATGEFGKVVREAGFCLDPESTAPIVAEQARYLRDIALLEESVQHPIPRQAVAQKNDVLPTDVKIPMMWKILDDKETAEWYLTKLAESGLDVRGMNADYVLKLRAFMDETKTLRRAEILTADVGIGWMGLGPRMSWLLFVSMLVCGIGISNAMLMTVTERFREIATMKCLGALDGFIMAVFVLESCLLGLFGGIVGGILGNIIGISRALSAFGIMFLSSLPLADLLIGTTAAVSLGIALAALASVYPSLKAARLAPMEAMRIE